MITAYELAANSRQRRRPFLRPWVRADHGKSSQTADVLGTRHLALVRRGRGMYRKEKEMGGNLEGSFIGPPLPLTPCATAGFFVGLTSRL